jgi:hypothetical protein
MLTNIDYMIDYGRLVNNPQAAKIFDAMEMCVQDMSDKLTQPKEGSIEFVVFTGKKKQPEPRLRGYAG